MKIADREIGPDKPLYIIAEMGLAHLGSLDLALQMLHAAADAGADAIKTQWWKVEDSNKLRSGPRKPSRCLSKESLDTLRFEAKKRDIHFLCTPHDEYALNYLYAEVPAIKIGSGERGSTELTKIALDTRLPVIISTGGFTSEHWHILDCLLLKYPREQWARLACVSDYPTTWRSKFPLFSLKQFAGWSSHTGNVTGIDALFVAQGAYILEKHIKPDLYPEIESSLDMKASINIGDFRDWVAYMNKCWKTRNQ